MYNVYKCFLDYYIFKYLFYKLKVISIPICHIIQYIITYKLFNIHCTYYMLYVKRLNVF